MQFSIAVALPEAKAIPPAEKMVRLVRMTIVPGVPRKGGTLVAGRFMMEHPMKNG